MSEALEPFKASWCGPDVMASESFGVFLFRHALTLDKVPSSRRVRVSADQRFRLYVNGHLVAWGPQRGDRDHWHYDTVDLAPWLKSGENMVHVVVWNWGTDAPMAQIFSRTGLMVDGEGLNTPGDWEWRRVTAHHARPRHPDMNRFYWEVGPSESVDSAGVPSWEHLAQVEAHDWRKTRGNGTAVPEGAVDGGSGWWLRPRSLPPMRYDRSGKSLRVVEADDTRKAWTTLELKAGDKVLLDAQELLCAFPRVTVRAEGDGQLEIGYAEALYDDKGNKFNRNETRGKHFVGPRDELVFHRGENTFEPLWWRTYRYVQLEAHGPCTVEAFESYETGYPYEVLSTFTSPTAGVCEIWDVGVRTAQRCAGETYFDCPYYEQLQYTGDTRIQVMLHMLLGHDRQMARNAVDQFTWDQTDGGLTVSRYPCREKEVIPPFSLWWIHMVADQHLYDRVPLSDRYKRIGDNILREWRENLLLHPESSYWCFLDWLDWSWGQPPGGALATPHQALLAWTEAVWAKLLGRSLDPVRRYLKEFVVDDDGLVKHPRDPGVPTEHGEAMYRMAQRELGLPMSPWPYEGVEKAKAPKTTYYFSYYRHQAQPEVDYWKLIAPWRDQIALGLTTFVEMNEPSRSDCHAWSAHPLLGFLQRVAGVTSTAAGWTEARVAPNPGSLTGFEAKLAHPDGDLVVTLDDGRLEVRCPVPFETVWGGKTGRHPAGRVVVQG
ncbi:MAG: hypothetical protein KF857_01515 [Fimbriimonadaceae bacterium]|nr:hypothetical protein [Fimbriimonadaceae bacterium]